MRYDVSEIEGFGDTRVFKVVPTRAIAGPNELAAENVWYNASHRVPLRCVGCNTPLRGMSASCKHVAAVRRYLAARSAP